MSHASMLLPKRLVATFIKDMWSVELESFNKIVIPTYIYCMNYILNTIVLFMEVNIKQQLIITGDLCCKEE